ncbi:MAG TPA: methyltransferase domain-containing protein [Anaerolineales bacterium]|nr:methyltransferase domain-containing protein [Anaerolineales bacterium]
MSLDLTLGKIQVSQAADEALRTLGVSLDELLHRHQSGDWMEEGQAAQRHNEFAAEHGLLIAAEYKLTDGQGILIVTAQDRSHTSVLLPDEFQYKEVGVVEGYARWSDRYDHWKNPLTAVEEPVVIELLQELRFNTVLDVGTGTGRHAVRLARHGVRVIGCDLSREMLKVAQSKISNDNSLSLVQTTTEASLPFPQESFDLLLCSLVLSHVRNLKKCIQEFARVQAKPGNCFVSAFHPDAISTARWRTSLQETDAIYRLPNMSHTREDYTNAFQDAGYTIKQVIDLRVKDVPEGHFTPMMIDEHGDKGLCLIVLAELA